MGKRLLCHLFGVARSSYYEGIKPLPINADTVKLNALIKQVFNESRGSAGARTISAIVTHQHGMVLSRYMASKLMKEMGLVSRQLRHTYRRAQQAHHVYDNTLNRDFSPSQPNHVWTGDVTYVRIKGGWCYLAVVIDLFARRIVGFAVSDSPDSQLTSKALKMAYEARLKPTGVLFHSDQGTHYTSKMFAHTVTQCGDMRHSMSRRGNCWDNAPTERFFRSFKTEWMPKGGYHTLKQATNDITDYIWGYYHLKRPHRHNDYLTPIEFEKRFFNQNLLISV